MIFFASLIPVFTAIALFWGYKHKTKWWEFLIPFILSLVLIGISKAVISTARTADTEFWGGYVLTAEYYEDWNEYVHRTCTRQNCTGSGDNRSCSTEFYDCSYVAYHSEKWMVHDSNRKTLSISKKKFEELASRWDNRVFVDLRRNYHNNDGDKYVATWGEDDETLEPTIVIYRYENRVQAAESVFGFEDVDPTEFGLYNYPGIKAAVGYNVPSLIGPKVKGSEEADHLLSFWNAKLGRQKKLRMWMLVFVDKPLQAGLDQEAYWKGGNKNEFVLTVGVDSEGSVQWAHPFSWTDVESLKVDVRNYVAEQDTIDLIATANYMKVELEEKFVKKDFADFDYLTVEPPLWTIVLTFFLVLAVNIGLSFWIVLNEFDDEGSKRRYQRWV